jgi:adenylate kinase
MPKNTYLFENTTALENFNPRANVVTCFIEYQNQVLVLKRADKSDQSFVWCIPGGKLEKGKDLDEKTAVAREVFEETGIDLPQDSLSLSAMRYARVPGWDYTLHIYHVKLNNKAVITLSNEHIDMKWIPLWQFKSLTLIKGQDEAFDIVYNDLIWKKKIADDGFLLIKGKESIKFNESNRLIFNLIGTPGSGKGTQGKMLSQIYGIPHISIGDLFRDNFRNKTSIGRLIMHHDSIDPDTFTPAPDEIYIGIISKRLSQDDCSNGFILDGFPRTSGQSEFLVKLLLRPGDIHFPIFMDLNEKIIKNRIQDRYICPGCGTQVGGHDGVGDGFCPKESCNKTKLKHRAEDTGRKLERRFEIFRDNKEGILKILSERDSVIHISLKGDETPTDVLVKICSITDNLLDNIDKIEETLTPIESIKSSNKGSLLNLMYKKYQESHKTLLVAAVGTVSLGATALAYRARKKHF